jgi:SNF2 family DNA or RNA helicase
VRGVGQRGQDGVRGPSNIGGMKMTMLFVLIFVLSFVVLFAVSFLAAKKQNQDVVEPVSRALVGRTPVLRSPLNKQIDRFFATMRKESAVELVQYDLLLEEEVKKKEAEEEIYWLERELEEWRDWEATLDEERLRWGLRWELQETDEAEELASKFDRDQTARMRTYLEGRYASQGRRSNNSRIRKEGHRNKGMRNTLKVLSLELGCTPEELEKEYAEQTCSVEM